jgi:hypothetical protein
MRRTGLHVARLLKKFKAAAIRTMRDEIFSICRLINLVRWCQRDSRTAAVRIADVCLARFRFVCATKLCVAASMSLAAGCLPQQMRELRVVTAMRAAHPQLVRLLPRRPRRSSAAVHEVPYYRVVVMPEV